MDTFDEYLTLRVPKPLVDKLKHMAAERMISVSALVRLTLAEGLGMIEPPSVLVDPTPEYEVGNDD